MFDFQDLNFDADGDGVADSYAESADLDGDGIEESLLVDMGGDGSVDAIFSDFDQDGYMESLAQDTDGNGVLDRFVEEFDSDGDGILDSFAETHDYDQDGVMDDAVLYSDADGNGTFDQVTEMVDTDGDGMMDDIVTYVDADGDGTADLIVQEFLLDTDGDGIVDTYVNQLDTDGDGVFDSTEVYDYDPATGVVELVPIDDPGSASYQDLENFDPSQADPEDITGDPASSMEEWEYQGGTNRCALYSQKFIIDELTGQDVDIEQMADLAEENGWFSEEGGTPLLHMNKMLDYFGVENEMSFHNSEADLRECLENGGKVIVAVDADEIWYGETDELFAPTDGANHAVQVIGIDDSDPENPMVILNDSGSPDGCGEMVPLDVFMDAWDDSSNQMIECY